MMKQLIDNLFSPGLEETLGEKLFFRFFELFLVVYMLVFVWDWAQYIPQIETVLLPLGIAGYVDVSFMFGNNLAFWNAGAITIAAALGVSRILPGVAYWIAIALFHLQYVSRYSLGEISHGSNMIGVSILALAVAMSLFNNPTHRRRFALGFIYFFVGLGYVTAAFAKMIGTGLNWPNGRHLWMWINERYIDSLSEFGLYELNFLQEMILGSVVVGTIVLLFGLIVEFCGFLMWFRKTRYFITPVIIAMHAGVLMTMNIAFNAFTLQLIFLALPWANLIDRAIARRPEITVQRLPKALLARL